MVVTTTEEIYGTGTLRDAGRTLRLELLAYSFWPGKQRGKSAASAVPSAGYIGRYLAEEEIDSATESVYERVC